MSVNGARPGVRERLTRWDTHLTCLDEKQKECFIELSSTAANRPLPEHVSSVFSSVKNTLLRRYRYLFTAALGG